MNTTEDTAGRVAEFGPGLVPPAGVRAGVFDVVGTLVEPHPSVAVAYQRAASPTAHREESGA